MYIRRNYDVWLTDDFELRAVPVEVLRESYAGYAASSADLKLEDGEWSLIPPTCSLAYSGNTPAKILKSFSKKCPKMPGPLAIFCTIWSSPTCES